ncbi:MAG: hypothetical protein E6J31_17260 [Chloroflexi bacterium]|nr:MAG: hypothetical protein E6J31_17260 [Chloroflexota bacterium]TMD68921.1 MAG: hypothetical protein E6I91_03435 [Chloroflexota bacterium]
MMSLRTRRGGVADVVGGDTCVALVPRCLACSPLLGGPRAPSPHPTRSRPYGYDPSLTSQDLPVKARTVVIARVV